MGGRFKIKWGTLYRPETGLLETYPILTTEYGYCGELEPMGREYEWGPAKKATAAPESPLKFADMQEYLDWSETSCKIRKHFVREIQRECGAPETMASIRQAYWDAGGQWGYEEALQWAAKRRWEEMKHGTV